MELSAYNIHTIVAQVCPVVSVSVPDTKNKSTWKIAYDPSATQAQRDAAEAAIQNIDVNSPVVIDPLDTWDIISLKAIFNHENRIRALEGKAAITQTQFRNAIKALL